MIVKNIIPLFISVVFWIIFPHSVFAKEYRVSSSKQIDKINHLLKAGDTVILENGVWNNQQINLIANGQEDKPITLKAETPSKVTLTGNSRLFVKGNYIVVSGLLFKEGALNGNNHVIRLQGSHHRLTQSAIIDYNPKSIQTRYFWVSLYGHNHRVDHNYFSGQRHSGVTTVVWLNEGETGHHRIDNNYYGQRPKGDGNGFETIRIGTGKYSHINSFVQVDNNVFEETDGEIEIISNKSNYNIYRNNTFVNSSGTLTIRQGTHNIVANNYFLGQLRRGSGGVRVISTDQLIANNHFEHLAGRAKGVISITAGNGILNKGKLPHYPRVERSMIIGNTCINNKQACIHLNAGLGERKRTLLAKNLLIANNIFYRDKVGAPFIQGKTNNSVQWHNNFASGSDIGYDTQQGIKQTSLSVNKLYHQVHKPNKLPKPWSCNELVSIVTKANWKNIDLLESRCNIAENNQSNEVKPKFRNNVGPSWMQSTD